MWFAGPAEPESESKLKTILAPRACAILYDLLVALDEPRPFLLPANICPIVPITFLKARVPFEFVDVSAQTLNMDPDQALARLAGGDYAGVLYAHTYGDPSTPHEFFGELKRCDPGLLVVDDRCLCVPDLEPGPPTAADITLYSTGYAKVVDIGSGGYAFSSEPLNINHHSLPFHASDLNAVEAGYKASIGSGEPYVYTDSNWLCTDEQALKWRDYVDRVRPALVQSLAHRRSINAVYNSLIPLEVQLEARYQTWRFNLRVDRQQAILGAIFEAGLFASSHYASLVGIMGAGSGGHAREFAGRVINLFNDRRFTLEMAERTAEIVRRSL